MKTSLKIAVSTLVLVFSASAFAEGLFLEPALTYESGNNKVDWNSNLVGDSTGTTKGGGFSLKVGAEFADIAWIALDGAYSKPQFKNSATDYTADADSTLFGADIGVQMPIVGLRLWGGYIFDGQINPQASGAYNVKFTGASGPKIGAGFHILMLSLNVEYLDLKYKNSYLEQAGPFTPSGTIDGNYTNKMVVFSVSLPVNL
jgi:hypothetical protein